MPVNQGAKYNIRTPLEIGTFWDVAVDVRKSKSKAERGGWFLGENADSRSL